MPNKPGQPTKFPAGRESAIKMLVLKGCTDAELAKAFDVTEQTVNNWKKAKPKFFESLKEWKLEADEKVEKALYHRALGAKVKEQKPISFEGQHDIIETTKEYPPDTAACIAWLANRNPDRWKKDPGESGGTAEKIADAFVNLMDRLPS